MEQITVVNQNGKAVNTLQIPPSLMVNSPFSPFNLSLVYRSYQANQHQATKKVKSRGEVKGSTRKIYRQKGTGGARHGARYAPQFVGGGVAHGPRGWKRKPLKINFKLKKKALQSVLGEKIQQKKISVIDQINLSSPKTKEAVKLLDTLGIEKTNLLLILTPQEKTDSKITSPFRNLPYLNKIRDSKSLNFLEVISSEHLIFTSSALNELAERLN
ncbi:MAG: 50S ribosomal protein L4 [Candidatus Moeniiplasma glomeromycotorum]|nr:50S ribosomal protein L4 [Candidatus Moeniiplasma glomeromycotorum]MCE8167045.1 50S ribosomal protein L4 [Candidatus Moeniiplasma glomeromycotorum]MCE8168943.1 50S ribosomal protein L4 [Candidatus Moeniiplasma glomeromycotorum]